MNETLLTSPFVPVRHIAPGETSRTAAIRLLKSNWQPTTSPDAEQTQMGIVMANADLVLWEAMNTNREWLELRDELGIEE